MSGNQCLICKMGIKIAPTSSVSETMWITTYEAFRTGSGVWEVSYKCNYYYVTLLNFSISDMQFLRASITSKEKIHEIIILIRSGKISAIIL